ncbi:MAG: hypothetical protein ABJA67_17150, partial [Chthonomonadales bacterium]
MLNSFWKIGCATLAVSALASLAMAEDVRVWQKDGAIIEGVASETKITFAMPDGAKTFAVKDILSFNSGDAGSPDEERAIEKLLPQIGGADKLASEKAVAVLAEIGLPVMTPLLKSFKDTDMHEPYPLYRLFARIMPSYADEISRTQDILRLANGQTLRGKLVKWDLTLDKGATGKIKVPIGGIRRFAVKRKLVERTLHLDALRHCTYVEFMDSGIETSTTSDLEEMADGYVRLSFDMDGWASDPDGLKVPGPNYKTNLVDGHPFGALIARVSVTGPRFFLGKKTAKPGVGQGKLYFAINDNPHW